MPTFDVTNFAVQYSNLDADDIAASGHDLVIIEGSPGQAGLAGLSDAEVATLVAGGQSVIGYVSVGQTDDARPYWDATWTDDGTDTGNPTDAAPAWLAEKAESWPAAIVEYWNDDWKTIVLDQVADLATRGYSGIFLDNILSYYEIADLRGELGTAQSQFYAAQMMALVVEIAAHGQAINPDFKVIPNGGPYIIGDAGAFGTQAATDYLGAVDAIMAESFYGLLTGTAEENVLDTYESFWVANGVTVLALEYSTDQEDIDAFVADAQARGFAVSVSPDQALDVLPVALVGDVPSPQTGDGTPGPDDLTGTAAADLIKGLGGDDTLDGLAGDDSLIGGAGHDTLIGRNGDDVLWGQNGSDRLDGGKGDDDMAGGKGNDLAFGGNGRDSLNGAGGQDTLSGGKHGDTLIGGAGSDALRGGLGADVLIGGRGHDDLFGGGGSDTFVLDLRGDDFIGDFQRNLDSVVIDSNQRLSFEKVKGGAQIVAENGATVEFSGVTKAQLRDLVDNDTQLGPASLSPPPPVYGTDGDDTLIGTAENDYMKAGNGRDLVRGREGNDVMYGDARSDQMSGDKGNDRMFGGSGADYLEGRAGQDALFGGQGRDNLLGGNGRDVLRGGRDADTLFGEGNADQLYGGQGRDLLIGGNGDDVLFGGGGADVFLFDFAGDDRVGDFKIGRDTLELDLGVVPFDAANQYWRVGPTRDEFSVVGTANGARLEHEDGASMTFDGLRADQLIGLIDDAFGV